MHFAAQPSEIFSSFDEKPLGSASLAQVHRATLRSESDSGGEREVAVKVQHLKVKQHSMVDMYTMEFLAKVRSIIYKIISSTGSIHSITKNMSIDSKSNIFSKECTFRDSMLKNGKQKSIFYSKRF